MFACQPICSSKFAKQLCLHHVEGWLAPRFLIIINDGTIMTPLRLTVAATRFGFAYFFRCLFCFFRDGIPQVVGSIISYPVMLLIFLCGAELLTLPHLTGARVEAGLFF